MINKQFPMIGEQTLSVQPKMIGNDRSSLSYDQSELVEGQDLPEQRHVSRNR